MYRIIPYKDGVRQWIELGWYISCCVSTRRLCFVCDGVLGFSCVQSAGVVSASGNFEGR